MTAVSYTHLDVYKRQVVENINGGMAKVAELLGRKEAELATAAVPAGTGDTSEEHEAFDMNDFLIKRFRREQTASRRSVFRSTLFPADRSLIRGSNLDKLVHELIELLK